jgi:hypothetical protein
MKKSLLLLIFLGLFLSLSFISATCQLTPQLINQDPYPVVPGDYVKLVFQVSGIQNPDCNLVTFQLVPNYPISFDPGVSSVTAVNGGTYTNNYNSYAMIPYTVRVDPNAVDGNSTIEFDYRANGVGNNAVATNFNLSVQNVKSDFQVFVKNFDYATNDITFEVLNIGKNDVQSLTVTLPPNQDNLTVKGPSTNIIGSLSSNDFTTADFTVSPNRATIAMTLSYNDVTGVRRSVNKTVAFDPSEFPKPTPSYTGLIILVILVIAVVLFIFYRRHKKNKKKKLLRE